MKYNDLRKVKLVLFFCAAVWMALIYFVAAVLNYPTGAFIIAAIGFLVIPIAVFLIVGKEFENFRRKK